MKRCLNCMKEYEDSMESCPYCGYRKGIPPKEVYYLVPGMVLNDRYIIGTSCGAGGFGTVYRAWDKNLDKMVAIKEYYPASLVGRTPGEKNIYIYAKKREAEFKSGLERFLEEARYMAMFSTHPNIVNVYNFFEENGTAYIVMNFLEGVLYKDYIKKHQGIVSEDIAIKVTLAVLAALTDIHKAGIIHRDIAPDNVFILKNGTIKLSDFGAARFPRTDKEIDVVLKPGFAPAEQYQRDGKQGPYTDIYAVGAMLYRAVTGIMPPEATNRRKEECLIPPKEINHDISDNLNNIILRAMAMQPELRFQTTEEFRNALVGKKSVRDVEAELKRRKKKRIIQMAAAAAVLVTGMAVGLGMYGSRKAQTELKSAQLTMWVPVEEGKEDTTQSIYNNLVSGFEEDYSQIGINVELIPEDEYQAKISQAAGTKDMPDIYDSSLLTEGDLTDAVSVNRVFGWMNMDEYYGLDTYKQSSGKHLKMPVSFYTPLLYVQGADENGTVVSEEELANATDFTEESLQDFLNGKTTFLLADSSCYLRINSEYAARYHLQQIPEGVAKKGSFAKSFSISKSASTACKNAAYRFLYYMVSEGAQYELCIASQGDVNNGIPLNKKSFDMWLSVNMEMKGKAEEIPELSY